MSIITNIIIYLLKKLHKLTSSIILIKNHIKINKNKSNKLKKNNN